MSAYLCAAGNRMRAEIDARWPKRNRTSDGWAASAAHTANNPGSDHEPDPKSNPPGIVRAIDIDEDLNGRDGSDPVAANALAARIVARARRGDKRIRYVIFEGQIWSASSRWQPRPYRGANQHAHHLHVSFTAAGDTDGDPFGLAQ